MKRRLLLAAGALALVAALLAGSRWVRTLSFFEVRRVELVGGHYLTPVAVARALAIPPGTSIFADKAPLEARVLGMAGVVYLIGSAGAGAAILLASIKFLRERSARRARALFMTSNIYLLVMMVLLVVLVRG